MPNHLYNLVSELPTIDGAGIYRVTNKIFLSLVDDCPLGWCVVPIKCESNGLFSRAIGFESRFEVVNCNGREEVIEPTSGDVILSVDLVYNITSAHQIELTRLRS